VTQSLVIVCGDRRLRSREQQLCDYYASLDGVDPYRSLIPGGVLPLGNHEVMRQIIRPFVLLGVTHVHVEDHCADDDSIMGCGAYRLRFAENHEVPLDRVVYPSTTEREEHLAELDFAPAWVGSCLHQSERAAHPLTYTVSLYRHDELGFGIADILHGNRELPAFVASSSDPVPEFAGSYRA
jgi:hypothetical protein